MTGRLDYAKARRRLRVPSLLASNRTSLRGWRTEWPEEFPVTVTSKPIANPNQNAKDGTP
jgi:hypothetical protein